MSLVDHIMQFTASVTRLCIHYEYAYCYLGLILNSKINGNYNANLHNVKTLEIYLIRDLVT